MNSGDPLIRLSGVCYREHSPWFSRLFRAEYILKDISFSLEDGESMAVVGDEDSGKSELIALIAGLLEPTRGRILYSGQTAAANPRNRARNFRMIFQDQETSLNRKLRIRDILQIPLLINTGMDRRERLERIADTLNLVDLPESIAGRYPSELSHGQMKRVSFARALILNPRVILADKSISSFDPNLRAHICNMLLRLQKERRISSIITTSDLDLVRNISDRLLVLDRGEIVEFGDTRKILSAPQSPTATRLLMNYYNEYRCDADHVLERGKKAVKHHEF